VISVVVTDLLGYLGIIVTILLVGVGLAGLVLKLHNDTNRRLDSTNQRIDDTNQRIDEFNVRFVELEKGQARLEGFLAGMQGRTPPPDR
jgi:cell division protein FtsL